jgi:hypothetical protein
MESKELAVPNLKYMKRLGKYMADLQIVPEPRIQHRTF